MSYLRSQDQSVPGDPARLTLSRSRAHFDPISVCWECQMISHHCMWYSCQLKRYNEVLMKPDKVPKLKYNLDTILLTLVIDVSYCCLSPLLDS